MVVASPAMAHRHCRCARAREQSRESWSWKKMLTGRRRSWDQICLTLKPRHGTARPRQDKKKPFRTNSLGGAGVGRRAHAPLTQALAATGRRLCYGAVSKVRTRPDEARM